MCLHLSSHLSVPCIRITGHDIPTLMGVVPNILHTSRLIPKTSHPFRLHPHIIFPNQHSGSRDLKILATPSINPMPRCQSTTQSAPLHPRLPARVIRVLTPPHLSRTFHLRGSRHPHLAEPRPMRSAMGHHQLHSGLEHRPRHNMSMLSHHPCWHLTCSDERVVFQSLK